MHPASPNLQRAGKLERPLGAHRVAPPIARHVEMRRKKPTRATSTVASSSKRMGHSGDAMMSLTQHPTSQIASLTPASIMVSIKLCVMPSASTWQHVRLWMLRLKNGDQTLSAVSASSRSFHKSRHLLLTLTGIGSPGSQSGTFPSHTWGCWGLNQLLFA